MHLWTRLQKLNRILSNTLCPTTLFPLQKYLINKSINDSQHRLECISKIFHLTEKQDSMVGVDLSSIYYNSHRCFYFFYLSLKHIFFIYGFLSALLQSPQSGLKCRTKFTEIKFSVMHITHTTKRR